MTVALVLGRTVALVLVPTYPAALKFRVTLPSESEPRVYWPEVFVVLALTTFAAATLLFVTVPDIPRQANVVGFGLQWRGVHTVFRNARFWWLSPLAATGLGCSGR